MTEVNKNRTKTDEAWERLYARLNKDRLLVEAGQGRAVRRKLLLKWGTLAAAVIAGFVYLASALWFVPGGEVENLNLVTQENREASMLVTTLEDGSVVYLAQGLVEARGTECAGKCRRNRNLTGSTIAIE